MTVEWTVIAVLVVLLVAVVRQPAPAPAPVVVERRVMPLLTPGTVIPGVTLTPKVRVWAALESDDPDTLVIPPWPDPVDAVIDTTARTQEVPIIHFDDLSDEGGDE